MEPKVSLQCRVPPAVKRAYAALAVSRQMTESALLRQQIDALLPTSVAEPPVSADSIAWQSRLQFRLTAEDRQLLSARAERRGVPPSTYASILVRAHLRSVAPLPEQELASLRQSTRELAAIGRHLRALSRLAEAGRPGLPAVDAALFTNFLRICEALRDHFRGYIERNLHSWGTDGQEP